MSDTPPLFNVLFLCTGNSARSILAEAYLNHAYGDRFRAFSAGSHPGGTVNPYAIDVLNAAGISTEGARSKSWDEFAVPGSPRMDFIFTVCDNAAGEVCPVWPGHPTNAHWPFEDPAAFVGKPAETRLKFVEVFKQVCRRIDIFTSLPLRTIDKMALERKLKEIGRSTEGAEQ
tara:strand:+ start:71886 stop:72404 length:519 start_codon:yes stop_codon:yes gene_type:complete